MNRYIYFREVLAVLSNKKIENVDIPTATARIRSILMSAEGFNYDPKKSIQKNILDFYAEKGYPELWETNRRFSAFYTELLAERNIRRIIQRKQAPEVLEVKIRRNTSVESDCGMPILPVVWKKTDYGTENAYCSLCGKMLYSTICLHSPSIRGYDECDCRKSS